MGTVQSYKKEVLNPSEFLQDQEVYKHLFHKYDDMNLSFDFLLASAPKEVSKRDTYHHWENPELLTVGTVTGAPGGTPGAGNNVTVTLAAADHANSGKSSPFPIKTLVKIRTAASGEIGGRVIAKNTTTDGAHVLTIKPAKATVDIVTATASGDKIIDISNAKGDGTGWVAALRREPIKKQNNIQIISTESTVYLGEAANMQKVEFQGLDGKKSMAQYNQSELDALIEAKIKVGTQLIIGDYSEDYVDEDEGNEVLVTKSLNESIVEPGGGLDASYSGATPTLTDFDAICDYMDVESSTSRMFIYPGPQISREYDKLFKGQFDNGQLDFTNWGVGSAQGKVVDFGFDGWKYGNYEFAKKKNVKEFSAKGRDGGVNPWLTTAFFIPDGQKTDAKTQESIPRMRLRYRNSGLDNRMVKRIDRNPENLGVDQKKIAHQMECGAEFFGIHQFIKQSKA